jgi:hypothetical protein
MGSRCLIKVFMKRDVERLRERKTLNIKMDVYRKRLS